jgi:hypothetical protein
MNNNSLIAGTLFASGALLNSLSLHAAEVPPPRTNKPTLLGITNLTGTLRTFQADGTDLATGLFGRNARVMITIYQLEMQATDTITNYVTLETHRVVPSEQLNKLVGNKVKATGVLSRYEDNQQLTLRVTQIRQFSGQASHPESTERNLPLRQGDERQQSGERLQWKHNAQHSALWTNNALRRGERVVLYGAPSRGEAKNGKGTIWFYADDPKATSAFDTRVFTVEIADDPFRAVFIGGWQLPSFYWITGTVDSVREIHQTITSPGGSITDRITRGPHLVDGKLTEDK